MSIKQILEKAWRDCKKEGVELDSVMFQVQRFMGGSEVIIDVRVDGKAIRKPQSQPDEKPRKG